MATHRIYYDDSFARDFEAKVVACEPCVHGTTPAWEVVLDESALYPASGGQPCDRGKLGDANVLEVRDDGDEVVHIVDRELRLGPVHGCVDWPRRFDHMQQHTGQHLLSAMFQERFGRQTVSFHLGAELSSIDLRGAEPTAEILEGAERAANRIIFEDRPINVRYGTQEELAEMGVRKEVQRTGILRAIEIEGSDLQPCGGTHVRRTAQIGTLLVRRCTKMRQDWRVEFACGARSERLARNDFRLISRTATNLGCAADDLADAAARVTSERECKLQRSAQPVAEVGRTGSGIVAAICFGCDAGCSNHRSRFRRQHSSGLSGLLLDANRQNGECHRTRRAKGQRPIDLFAAPVGRKRHECAAQAGIRTIYRQGWRQSRFRPRAAQRWSASRSGA